MEIESATHRQQLAVAVSLIAHTLTFGLLMVPSKPTRTAGPNRQAQIAGRRPALSDTKTQPAQVDRSRQLPTQPDASKPLVPIESTTLLIPGFTFDFGKIASRASVLFPFLDLQFSIPAGPAARFRDVDSRQGRGLVFVHAVVAQRSDGLPRLRLTNTAFQTIVDVSWSRRARWTAFRSIRTMTDQYSGEEGSLPTLVRAYVDANVLQPFYDTTIRDPRLWSQLDIAAEHVDFIQFIVDYAVRHPSTKATTELLFLLDKLAQASFDALTILLDTEPKRDLRWTAEANLDAYRLIRAIRAFYLDRLGELATNRAALKARYDAMRLQILRSIVRTTPEEYRANDARFLIGAIAWRAGDRETAVRTWDELQIRQTDYYAASSSYVLRILNEERSGALVSSDIAARIDRVLDNEYERWLTFSSARLRRFGYATDTF
jgi:hypothetical protein